MAKKKRKVAIRSGVRKESPKAPKPKRAKAKVADVVIRDRIKELRRVKASDLVPNPPRAQKNAVAGVLQEIGYADAVLARETPGGLMLIDGHLRRELTPNQEIPVLVLDVTEAEARTMLALLDPLAAMAGVDKVNLAGLLKEVEVDSAALDDMLGKMAARVGIATEDDGENCGREAEAAGQYNVLVVCKNEGQQLQLLERFMEEGLECRGLIS